MEIYYVTTQPDTQGAHEVHTSTCSLLPVEGRRYLGTFPEATKAVFAGRHYFNIVHGCATCCALTPHAN
jgi:hypothetical protein